MFIIGLLEIILIAIGLSMDAFAVSITLGLTVKTLRGKEFVLPGLYFGMFQALMPMLGYFAGIHFADKMEAFDHWIAFALLGFIGAKMIKDSFSKDEKTFDEHSFQFTKMLLLAVATSIDAFAVGITFSFFAVNIFSAIVITGLTTFVISLCGVKIGNIFGNKFKAQAEFAGGAILIILGIKIVVEHLFLSD